MVAVLQDDFNFLIERNYCTGKFGKQASNESEAYVWVGRVCVLTD